MKYTDSRSGPWRALDNDERPSAGIAVQPHLLLTLDEWRSVRGRWPRGVPVGVRLANDAEVEDLGDDLPRLGLVTLAFPKWTDGRAYSQARLLRARLRYAGELRATGEVLADMLPLLARTGFDAVELRADQRQDTAERALRHFDRHYQGDTLDPRPLFGRPPAWAGAASRAAEPDFETAKADRMIPTQPTSNRQAAPDANDRQRRATTARAIDLYARATHGFDARVAHATAVLQSAALEHAGRIVQVTSLGVEGMVLTDLIAREQLGIAVATIDTGRLHAQTSALVPAIAARYGIAVEVYRPQQQSVVRFVQANGEDAMLESIALRKACCELRKVEPLSRLLAGRSAWVTGLRREQSHARAVVTFHEQGDAGRVKFNPLADWSWADVWHYIAQNDVPYNPLHDEFMPSIGCAPCTRAIPVGADFRSGRWWWESDSAKECGLHVRTRPGDAAPATREEAEASA